MTATRTASLMDDLALVLADAPMPRDPFEAADVMAAAKQLGGALTTYMAKVRAERVANAVAWAAFNGELATLDPGHKPPPPPPPPPDEEPDPQPAPDPGGDT